METDSALALSTPQYVRFFRFFRGLLRDEPS